MNMNMNMNMNINVNNTGNYSNCGCVYCKNNGI